MIKRYWKLLLALAVSLAVLVGYRVYDGIRTDSTPPQITVSDGEILAVSANDKDALLQGVTATDDRDGDVTGSIVVESVGSVTEDNCVTVVYAAFDSSGNVAKLRRTVRFTDYVSPRFSLTQSLSFTYGSGFDVLDVVKAQDMMDGDISYRVKATSLDGTSVNTEGVHSVRFQVTNSLGDTAELVLPVEVCYAGRYNAQLSLSEYLIYLDDGAEFDAKDYLRTFLARGEEQRLNGRIPAGMTLAVDGRVDTDVPGVYPVSYTVTQTVDGVEYVGYARLIVVVEG